MNKSYMQTAIEKLGYKTFGSSIHSAIPGRECLGVALSQETGAFDFCFAVIQQCKANGVKLTESNPPKSVTMQSASKDMWFVVFPTIAHIS